MGENNTGLYHLDLWFMMLYEKTLCSIFMIYENGKNINIEDDN